MNKKNNIEIKKEGIITFINIKKKSIYDLSISTALDNYGLLLNKIIFLDDNNLDKQLIFLFEEDEYNYIVILNHNKIIISKKSDSLEFELIIDRVRKNYIINGISFNDKKEKLLYIQQLLDKLYSFNIIREYMLCYDVYDYFLLVSDKNYYPVIKNNFITLSWPFRINEEDINKSNGEFLDIILNDTRERIGEIAFFYSLNDNNGFTYDGNVSYSIYSEFRNKGYATMALKLLKKMLKNNLFDGNKDLYISTLPNNYYSQKVALKNGGTLYYDGDVPSYDVINFTDGVKKVKVYKIKM